MRVINTKFRMLFMGVGEEGVMGLGRERNRDLSSVPNACFLEKKAI